MDANIVNHAKSEAGKRTNALTPTIAKEPAARLDAFVGQNLTLAVHA